MKDSIKRRLDAIERTVADEIGPERVPVIVQQGFGGPSCVMVSATRTPIQHLPPMPTMKTRCW